MWAFFLTSSSVLQHIALCIGRLPRTRAIARKHAIVHDVAVAVAETNLVLKVDFLKKKQKMSVSKDNQLVEKWSFFSFEFEICLKKRSRIV